VDVQKVGNELSVSALVSGRVVPRGDSIEVSAELTDVRDNNEIWGQHYSGKSADIISLQQQIASDIAAKLRSSLSTSEKQQETKQGTQNPEAYELYLKGRYWWNKPTARDIEDSISYFNQAIAKDPGLRSGIFGSSRCYSVLPPMAAPPAKTIRSRMPLPARRCSWTRHWRIPMLFWATTSRSTTFDFCRRRG
jgi:hypothetical protein